MPIQYWHSGCQSHKVGYNSSKDTWKESPRAVDPAEVEPQRIGDASAGVL